jgi:hypothetical protein
MCVSGDALAGRGKACSVAEVVLRVRLGGECSGQSPVERLILLRLPRLSRISVFPVFFNWQQGWCSGLQSVLVD